MAMVVLIFKLPLLGGRRWRPGKGEFGVYLIADGTNRSYKCKIRAPSFAHLSAMDFLTRGLPLSDYHPLIVSPKLHTTVLHLVVPMELHMQLNSVGNGYLRELARTL
jgi:Respiratory-chain NADH dehydrogenase, 49 Kd subunit